MPFRTAERVATRASKPEDTMSDLEPSEIESAWFEEVERRIEEFDRGELSLYPAEDVFAEARRLV